MTPDALLTREQLAAHYGVCTETISRWVKRGCPVRRASSHRSRMWFDPAEVDAWLAQPK